MPTTRYPIEDIARRGDEIYNREVRSKVEGKCDGQIVAIDVDTAFYAIGDMAATAAEPVLAKNPEAEIWFVRVGERAVYHFGYWKKQPEA